MNKPDNNVVNFYNAKRLRDVERTYRDAKQRVKELEERKRNR